jgi:hypothetical protein
MSRLTKRFRINTFSMRSTRERVSDETLRLSFGTHEVVIPGRNLSGIATALQDLAVEQISAVPPRYRELPHDEGGWIRQIEIRLTE